MTRRCPVYRGRLRCTEPEGHYQGGGWFTVPDDKPAPGSGHYLDPANPGPRFVIRRVEDDLYPWTLYDHAVTDPQPGSGTLEDALRWMDRQARRHPRPTSLPAPPPRGARPEPVTHTASAVDENFGPPLYRPGRPLEHPTPHIPTPHDQPDPRYLATHTMRDIVPTIKRIRAEGVATFPRELEPRPTFPFLDRSHGFDLTELMALETAAREQFHAEVIAASPHLTAPELPPWGQDDTEPGRGMTDAGTPGNDRAPLTPQERLNAACDWSDYRKDYGVSPDPDTLRLEHRAFLAGWEAARP